MMVGGGRGGRGGKAAERNPCLPRWRAGLQLCKPAVCRDAADTRWMKDTMDPTDQKEQRKSEMEKDINSLDASCRRTDNRQLSVYKHPSFGMYFLQPHAGIHRPR